MDDVRCFDETMSVCALLRAGTRLCREYVFRKEGSGVVRWHIHVVETGRTDGRLAVSTMAAAAARICRGYHTAFLHKITDHASCEAVLADCDGGLGQSLAH